MSNERKERILGNMAEAIDSIPDERGLHDLEKISEGILIGTTVLKGNKDRADERKEKE